MSARAEILAGYDNNSGGTGKPAVAYEAARSHARAAFCIKGSRSVIAHEKADRETELG